MVQLSPRVSPLATFTRVCPVFFYQGPFLGFFPKILCRRISIVPPRLSSFPYGLFFRLFITSKSGPFLVTGDLFLRPQPFSPPASPAVFSLGGILFLSISDWLDVVWRTGAPVFPFPRSSSFFQAVIFVFSHSLRLFSIVPLFLSLSDNCFLTRHR